MPVVLTVVVVGVAAVVFALASRSPAEATPPTINDHWHAAYGFSVCDNPQFIKLNGNLEDPTQTALEQYNRTGVHSHDDGVIHWHAFTSAATGARATLGLFLDNYNVDLSDDTLTMPAVQGDGATYLEGSGRCGNEPGQLSITVWQDPHDTTPGTTYTTNLHDLPITKDGLVFTIAYQPPGTQVTKPPWAADLAQLGAADVVN